MSFGDWENRQYLLPKPYLGGHFLDRGFPLALSWNEPSGVRVRETHAGTHKIWKPFSENKAPVDMQGISVSIDLYRVTEEDKRVIASLIRRGEVILYADGRDVTDYFPNVTAGDSRKLTRPLAINTVSGVTEQLFPTVVRLDDVEDAAAATVTGQDVSILKTGDVEVRYTPVYSVVFLTQDWQIANYNDLNHSSIQMVEVIQADFS